MHSCDDDVDDADDADDVDASVQYECYAEMHAFIMPHANVCMTCIVACVLLYAYMAACMHRCMIAT